MEDVRDFPTARDNVRPRRPLRAWFDVRREHVGFWAFALNRLTALGVTLYLFLHLGVLSQLARGPSQWDAFVALAHSPFYLALDVVLIFGILFHGLNGIRLALVGMGIAVRQHRTLFWVASAIGSALLVISAIAVFTN